MQSSQPLNKQTKKIRDSFFGQTLNDIEKYLDKNKFKTTHATSLFQSIYKKGILNFEELDFLPDGAKEILKKELSTDLPKVIKEQISEDEDTVKLLVQLEDGHSVETVLVPFHKKYTICLSSQVGCAMKCSFCYTGTQGLTRHLKAHEIIGQYLLAYNWIKKHKPGKAKTPNIVFMGQGEPLHNIDEIEKTLSILLTTEGLHLGPRQITLSTAGYLPGLKEFNKLKQINLALSFHSPFNEERSELIPLNKAYPIEVIIETLKGIKLLKRQFLTFEYLVIKDKNHSLEHAKKIGELLKGLPVIFNLIPFNEFPGTPYKRPDLSAVETFKENLIALGFHAMIRTTKGDDILAACGQLNTNED